MLPVKGANYLPVLSCPHAPLDQEILSSPE